MSEYDYSKYLNDDNSLNTGELWADVAAITGFYREGKRKDLYDSVTNWHYQHVKTEKEKSNALT